MIEIERIIDRQLVWMELVIIISRWVIEMIID